MWEKAEGSLFGDEVFNYNHNKNTKNKAYIIVKAEGYEASFLDSTNNLRSSKLLKSFKEAKKWCENKINSNL
jgi:hypothetical protein